MVIYYTNSSYERFNLGKYCIVLSITSFEYQVSNKIRRGYNISQIIKVRKLTQIGNLKWCIYWNLGRHLNIRLLSEWPLVGSEANTRVSGVKLEATMSNTEKVKNAEEVEEKARNGVDLDNILVNEVIFY